MKLWITMGLAVLVSLAASAGWTQSTASNEVEELVVVASRLPIDPSKIGRAISVLDADQIKQLGAQYAADLFRFIPGVAVSRTGGYGGLTQLRLRGSEANQVVVLIDGIDVSAAGTGEFDFSSLLAADIERIEVLRGPQSGLYGSNALAGVISIHTKRATQGFGFNTALEIGENNTQQTSLSVFGGSEHINGRLNYVVRKSEFDISENDSILGTEDDDDKNKTLSGQLHINVADALSLDVFARRTDKETDTDGFDFSGGPLQGLPIDNRSFSNTQDQSIGVATTLRFADGRSITKLTLGRSDAETDGGVFGSESQRDDIRLDSSWIWNPGQASAHRTTLFLQREEESFRNLYPFDPSQRATQERDLLGYGIEHRVEIEDSIFITASLRQDNNDKFEDTTTYSIDGSYRMNDGRTRIHASFGAAVTNPTFFEQFGFVPGTFVGNPNLEPEKSKGWDVGVEQVMLDGTLSIDLTYFDAELESEIQSLFPSVINVSGDSNREGAELTINYQPTHNTSVMANYTYTVADEPGGKEVLRPSHVASLAVSALLMDERASMSASVVYNGKMLDNDFRNFFTNGFMASRTKLDSYVLFNMNANYNVTDAFEVYVRVENLFDEDYVEVLGYATPGRTVFAGVRFNFAY
ncbi:MAG: TonB-dependent receptor [Gammaproteobacteria bacterium]|nr:TonB-dependent receptor [Gammaproteobacteria bacterium]